MQMANLTTVTFSFDVKDQLGGVTPTVTVIAGDNSNATLTGSASGYTDISLGNGTNKITLSGNYNAVDAGNNANTVSSGVSNNTITLANGPDSVTLGGGNNTITLGNGNDVVHGGTGDTISLVGTTLTLYGTDEMTFLPPSGNATVNDYSTGLDLKIGPTAGNDILSNFASDPSGVVDLIGGIGGFTTTSQVLSALKSDGHGGTLLSFGNGNSSSLDFTGIPPSLLHASNFQIS
jgi:hypothetical protein